ncbi:hypothetical protein [Lysobacter gummosus]|uniref:hypothetical protein n=1 Tax=Lysobacter gummosus TaxID=262324 RepID=UPI00362A42FC
MRRLRLPHRVRRIRRRSRPRRSRTSFGLLLLRLIPLGCKPLPAAGVAPAGFLFPCGGDAARSRTSRPRRRCLQPLPAPTRTRARSAADPIIDARARARYVKRDRHRTPMSRCVRILPIYTDLALSLQTKRARFVSFSEAIHPA